MLKKLSVISFILIMMTALGLTSFAADGTAKTDTGDTAFVILSISLVFLMTPALAFFYGGMVRKKNVLNTLTKSFTVIGLVSVLWVLIGYTLAFGPDVNGLYGAFNYLGLNVDLLAPNTDYAATIPHGAFILFQLMFAIITPAIITGAFVERMRFGVFVAFTVLWSLLVYSPLAHWVWAVGGWIRDLGALDFAGGTVVHISSGVAGLVAALLVGKRIGYKKESMLPHNIPFAILGATLLWLGWFGFNAGSALAANGLAIHAFITTNTAAAAGLVSWLFIQYIFSKKHTALGAATGALVGLVAITPAAGFVTPLAALFIGLTVSPICYFTIYYVKHKIGYDDSLDAFGTHGIGGIYGAIATGIFASKAVNSAGADGLLYGNINLLYNQLIAVGATILFTGIATYIILKAISFFTPLRVDETTEEEGLDVNIHGEEAYPE